MIYVTLDLQSYSVEPLRSLLHRAGFAREDFLFVLGYVIDRGDFHPDKPLEDCTPEELLMVRPARIPAIMKTPP